MNAQHTPGPWHQSDRRLSGPDGTQLAGFMLNGSTLGNNIETDAANCRLAAAAPDLLAALETILAESDGGWFHEHPTAEKARAAIAKAKGVSP